jgi:hypothetical protein
MKLIFTKDDDHQVTVIQEKGGEQKAFSYVDMIRALLDEGALEPTELNGDFTDPERRSINRMVGLINEAIESVGEEDATV